MKVTVFGGSGFIGSHVSDELTNRGHDVTIFDMHSSKYLQKNQKMIIGNITNENNVKNAIKKSDIVYNFAGIADIDDANNNPVDTIKYNVLGNTIILDACRSYDIKRYIFASTLYVYSNNGGFYRSSKQSCELIIENYNELFNIPYTILRYGSLYGPRSNEKNYIHKIIKQAIIEGKIISFGKKNDLREYIHVVDAAKYSVNILSDEFKNQYVILTGNQSIRRNDLLIMINDILGNKIDIEFSNENSKHYNITPYSFKLNVANTYSGKNYINIGQGLLQCINELHIKYYKSKG